MSITLLAQLIPTIIILGLLAFWMWMFWDMSNKDYLVTASKQDWTMRFILLNVFGAIMYYFNEYRRRY